MVNRRIVLYVVAVATAGSVVLSLVGRTDLAVAAFAVAAISMFGWVVLWARALNARIARLGADLERQDAEQQRRDIEQERRHAEQEKRHADLQRREAERDGAQRRDAERVSELGRAIDVLSTRAAHNEATLAGLRRDVYGVQVSVQRTPSASAELDRVYRRLVHHDHPMPELGGWAMTAATLVWIVDRIWSGEISTILECGSGSSTVWFALALEQRGTPGRIVSLESSPEYADQTRARLDELGLAHRATVLTAPLVDLELPGRAPQTWFDVAVLPDDVADMDLLFVDGPVGDVAPEARYPALPVLAQRLADDAWVVLDDTGRRDERSIVELWSSQAHGGRRFAVIHELDRATAFRGVE